MSGKPSSNNPWDVAPKAERGDEEPDHLYLAAGKATSAWEMIELQLGALFAVLCNSDTGAAQAAYGAIVATSVRQDIVLAAGRKALPNDLFEELKTMMTKVGKLTGRRNDIAHGVVMGFADSEDGQLKSHGHFLTPAGYSARTWAADDSAKADDPFWFKRRYAFTAEQVLAYAEHFRITSHDVGGFAQKVRDWRAMQPQPRPSLQ